MPEPRSVLLIATRQIGDVLLATPLLRTLRKGYPSARIDVLVYRNKGAMLEGNPDCDQVIEVSEHPTLAEYASFLPRLFRKYDLAVNTLAGDRPHLYSLWTAPQRIGVVAEKGAGWKRWLNYKSVALDNENTHTVLQNLALAEALGLRPFYQVVPPQSDHAATRLSEFLPFNIQKTRYAVLHPFPMWRYKRWTEEGWRALIHVLLQRIEHVVLTGGPDTQERSFIKRLREESPDLVHSLAGKVSFAEASELLQSARIYVGPDTAMTHLAAACGTPTVAIYGPSNPVKWGPWPRTQEGANPWIRIERPFRREGNVLLLQGVQPEGRPACMPCAEEGCERNKESDSQCLQELSAESVIQAVDQLLSH